MNILISGKPTGRLASTIKNYMVKNIGNNVNFQEDIFDHGNIENFSNYDVYISTAWNTKGNYKEDPINEKYAENTIFWLNKCRENNIYSIYLGTSDTSGFEDCI